MRTELQGWGRFPTHHSHLEAPRSEDEIRRSLGAGRGVVARGNGRSYGDSALGRVATLSTRHFNRMIAFDPETGILILEAGALLGDVIAAFLPRGWFPLVTPGTRHVTIGGMIASDVHGKNHHKDGAMRASVAWLDLMTADGAVLRCAPTENETLFDLTCGGMGLTGVILRAAIRLRRVESAWIEQRMLPAATLAQAIAIFEANHEATYSVAWIDCLASGRALGRSLVMLGEHARPQALRDDYALRPLDWPRKRKLTVPLDFPSWALNRVTLRAFNALYYRKGLAAEGRSIVDWDSYFYPLDAINNWNRIYGAKGFAQYQCVLPLAASEAGLTELLATIAAAGTGSFLAVLKRFGAQESAFSFPMEGYTLALDFPVRRSTFALLDRLDAITLAHGGRFYLAKDSRMEAATLHAADPRAAQFAEWRRSHGCAAALRSQQSERLDL
ncbi:FAD-binding oxidoreductase [Rhodobacter lacus]|uniref:FAD-dependent oxidoreductase n=1 Tax=Rhodobacter lacus TaxID=1641972 RepID=A0ABW5ABP2_9RHOB